VPLTELPNASVDHGQSRLEVPNAQGQGLQAARSRSSPQDRRVVPRGASATRDPAAGGSYATRRVCLTGAAGRVAYNLLFRLASGEVFGPDVPVSLRLIDVEEALPQLSGTVIELEDCRDGEPPAASSSGEVPKPSDPEVCPPLPLAGPAGRTGRGSASDRAAQSLLPSQTAHQISALRAVLRRSSRSAKR